MPHIQKLIESFLARKWLVLLLVLGLVIGVGISTVYRGVLGPKQRTDLTVFLVAGQAIAEGQAANLYLIENVRHWHYVYPPLLAILLAPVSGWPLGATVPLAYCLSLLCLIGTAWLSRHFPEAARPATTGPHGHASVPDRPAPWQIFLALLLCLPMILNSLTRGQLGILTLFFQAAIFFGYLKERKVLTGLLLAFAVTLKISPLAYLVFFFLMKKEWKILASTAVGFTLFFFLLPSLAIGFHQNLELLKIWKGLMSLAQSDIAYKNYLWGELLTPFAGDNQSLYAVVTRFFWPSEAAFLGHSNAFVRILTSSLGVALIALPFVRTRYGAPPSKQDLLSALVEFSLFPMLMLFTSPVTQIHHYTVIYFLFLAAFLLREQHPAGSWWQKSLDLSLGSCASCLALGMIFDWAGVWGLPLWGSIFLWATVLFAPRSQHS